MRGQRTDLWGTPGVIRVVGDLLCQIAMKCKPREGASSNANSREEVNTYIMRACVKCRVNIKEKKNRKRPRVKCNKKAIRNH